MAGEIPSHEDVPEHNGSPVLDKVAIKTPSPEWFDKYFGEIKEKQDSSASRSEELCLQRASQILEDYDMDLLDTRAVQSSSPNFSEDVLVVLQGEDLSRSKSLELLPQASDSSKVTSSAHLMEDPGVFEGSKLLSSTWLCRSDLSITGKCKEEDTLCHEADLAAQSQQSASACMTQISEVPLEEEEVSGHVEPFKAQSLLETSGCLEDDDILSLNNREGGSSKESELNGPEVLWTEESALLSERSEGSLTEELELHPEILDILPLLFSYSSGKPFRYTLSGVYSTLAGIHECGFDVRFEKVATFNAGDELLVIVHWSNVYRFEGGLCLIHGKGLAFRNKKITWQIQKCVLSRKKPTQEIYDIVLKEGKRIVSAACPQTNTSNTVRESHGEQNYTEYSVIRITGDGRCLFRAVAYGLSLRCGKGTPDESQQLQVADDLRHKVADELVKRRCETEWFIEGDFDVYVNHIRQPYIWGGEPEVLMLTYVLEVPITVYLKDQNTDDGIIAICKYGQEYGIHNPIRVLYDGHAHYEALQIK